MKQPTINDIHSYTIFANIDKRNGKIEGHQMYLTQLQMEAIEQIILSDKIKVDENPSYEVE